MQTVNVTRQNTWLVITLYVLTVSNWWIFAIAKELHRCLFIFAVFWSCIYRKVMRKNILIVFSHVYLMSRSFQIKFLIIKSIYLAYFSPLQEEGLFINFPPKSVLSFPLPCHTRMLYQFIWPTPTLSILLG